MSTPHRQNLPRLCESRLIRRIVFVVAAICVACLVIRPAHADKWALLIGIDTYKDKNHINNLGAASADARALKVALVEVAGFASQNVHVLVSEPVEDRGETSPDYANILRELEELAARVKPGDTVIVTYSGHGIESDGKTYLLPYDTEAIDEGTLTDTAIPTEKFRDRLLKVHAGTLLMAFDMCRTNPHKGAKGVSESNPLTANQIQSLEVPKDTKAATGDNPSNPVVVTLFACSPDQQSFEWTDKARGYFSYFLEQGLRGKAADPTGTVRLGPLADYVYEQVKETVRRDEGKAQEPFWDIAGSQSTALGLVLAVGTFPIAAPIAGKVDASVVDTIGRFRVVVSPTGAALSVDGVPMVGKLAAIDLGIAKERTIVLHAEAPGCTPEDRTVTIQRGVNPPIIVLLSGTAAALDAASPSVTGTVAAEGTVTNLLRLVADGGSVARFTRDDDGDTFTVRITSVASDPVHVRAGYRTSELQPGAQYEIHFQARAQKAHSIVVRCQPADGNQRSAFLDRTIPLETEYRDYHLTFTAASRSAGAVYAPLFLLGSRTGTVQIAHLTVSKIGN